MKKVLLITEQFDPTADVLISEFRRRDQPVIRWNLDQFPLNSTLSCGISGEAFTGAIVTDGKKVSFDEIGSVWCRGFVPSGFATDLNPEEREFTRKECQHSLNALLEVTDWNWVNNPKYERLASSKLGQLFVSRKLGFDIPKTIVSNDPDEIRRFYESCHRDVIYKASSQSMDLEPGKALFTNSVTDVELRHIESIKQTPGIFQERIPKAFELRVTVVGSKIFCAKIPSQEDDKTKMDWRKSALEVDLEPFELPQDLAIKIHTFMSEYKLTYGAMDFIVTPDDQYIFLENNPGGQYLWIEAATEFTITSALADELMAPCRVS